VVERSVGAAPRTDERRHDDRSHATAAAPVIGSAALVEDREEHGPGEGPAV